MLTRRSSRWQRPVPVGAPSFAGSPGNRLISSRETRSSGETDWLHEPRGAVPRRDEPLSQETGASTPMGKPPGASVGSSAKKSFNDEPRNCSRERDSMAAPRARRHAAAALARSGPHRMRRRRRSADRLRADSPEAGPRVDCRRDHGQRCRPRAPGYEGRRGTLYLWRPCPTRHRHPRGDGGPCHPDPRYTRSITDGC